MKVVIRGIVVVLLPLLLFNCSICCEGSKENVTLTILWFDWTPCSLLQTMLDDLYEDATVIVVCYIKQFLLTVILIVFLFFFLFNEAMC